MISKRYTSSASTITCACFRRRHAGLHSTAKGTTLTRARCGSTSSCMKPAPRPAGHHQVTPGRVLEVGGPKGSAIISLEGIDTHFFVGDETAVPAIGRRLEELPSSASAGVVIEADVETGWPSALRESRQRGNRLGSPHGHPPRGPAHDLIEMLDTLEFRKGIVSYRIAVESRAARAIRRCLREQRENRHGLDQGSRLLAARSRRCARRRSLATNSDRVAIGTGDGCNRPSTAP